MFVNVDRTNITHQVNVGNETLVSVKVPRVKVPRNKTVTFQNTPPGRCENNLAINRVPHTPG